MSATPLQALAFHRLLVPALKETSATSWRALHIRAKADVGRDAELLRTHLFACLFVVVLVCRVYVMCLARTSYVLLVSSLLCYTPLRP